MYPDDFSELEKTRKTILHYLLKAIEDIGPSNVLQIVTHNAKNCQAAEKEIEKIHRPFFFVTMCLLYFESHFQRFC